MIFEPTPKKLDIFYPFLLILLFLGTIVYLFLKVRDEKKFSGKPFKSTIKEMLLEEDETFAAICSLVILAPTYLFTYDLNFNIQEYIAITFIVLLFCYTSKIVYNKVADNNTNKNK